MKMKTAILALAVVSLLIGMTAFGAKPPQGAPGVSTKPTVTPEDEYMAVDWDTGTVTDAVKWSVDVEGTIYFDDGDDVDGDGDGEPADPEVMDFEVSFGTSDRTDDRDMIETDLTIPYEQLTDTIEAALGLSIDLMDTEANASVTGCTVKIKGINPGKQTQQNNDFSEPSDPFDLGDD